MFEKAFRLKLRFDSPKGSLTTEDLWDLPLTSQTGKANLDDIAKGLYRKLKDEGEISFVTEVKSEDAITQLKFDIVKHVITVRMAENQKALQDRQNSERKQRIMALIDSKEEAAMGEKTVEELRAMLATM